MPRRGCSFTAWALFDDGGGDAAPEPRPAARSVDDGLSPRTFGSRRAAFERGLRPPPLPALRPRKRRSDGGAPTAVREAPPGRARRRRSDGASAADATDAPSDVKRPPVQRGAAPSKRRTRAAAPEPAAAAAAETKRRTSVSSSSSARRTRDAASPLRAAAFVAVPALVAALYLYVVLS